MTDRLPRLKAHTIDGPARFSLTPAVWVRVQYTRDNVDTLQREFLHFLSVKRIYGPRQVRGGSSGGGFFAGAFTAEEAERVKVWLLERGCVEGEEL